MSRVIFSIFRGECCRNLPYSLKMMPEKILSFVYMLLILLPNFVNMSDCLLNWKMVNICLLVVATI